MKLHEEPDANHAAEQPIFRSLRESEREECLDLWVTVWPGEKSRAYFRRYFYGDVEWLPYYTQVAETDGRIVSAVQICKRTVACGEFSLTMGGVANVATLPEYRGRGYSTGCLKRAIAIMEADAMDFSLLFTGINGYYRQFGYADLPRVRTAVHVRTTFGLGAGRAGASVVRPAQPADMQRVRDIYEAFNRDRPIAVRRSAAYWRDWMRMDPESPPKGLLVAEDGRGSIEGYLYVGVFNSVVPYSEAETEARIIEYGVDTRSEDEDYSTTLDLLGVVAGLMQPSSARTLQMEIAITPAVRRALHDLAGEAETVEGDGGGREGGIKETASTSGMVRLLHPDNLLRSFIMCWNEPWMAAGAPPGRLAFETPYGVTQIDADGPLLRAEVLSAAEAGTAAPLSQSTLFGLLFGSVTPEQATGEPGARKLLAALFPQRDMVYWGSDGF